MEIKCIIVAVDFSAGSLAALSYAAELGRRFEARLVLVHVIDAHDLELIAAASGEDEAKVLGMLRREAGERLATFAAEADGSGVEMESLVSSGVPYHQIALKARELAADMIVMGGQGTGRERMAEIFFGSTAEKVVRLLPCPVLCVPGPDGARVERKVGT
jgi:nucleotide-binding universal stress UspA family protein